MNNIFQQISPVGESPGRLREALGLPLGAAGFNLEVGLALSPRVVLNPNPE